MDINNVTITGRIAQDPEIKYFEGGSIKTTISIASNYWSSKEKKEIPNFFKCEVWGRQAEFLANYGEKGSQICVTGSLKNSSYEDNDGNKKTRTFILIENLMLPKSRISSNEGNEQEIATDEEIPF